MKACAFVSLVLTSACDPGWHYEVPDAEPVTDDGLRFRVEAAPGLSALLYASAFTGKITVEITLERVEPSAALNYHPAPLRVVDANGRRLPNYVGAADKITCDGTDVPSGSKAVPITVSCTISNQFAITPLVRRMVPGFHKPNPDLRTVTISVPGVKYEGADRVVTFDARWTVDGS